VQDIEQISPEFVVGHSFEEAKFSKIAPLRVLSFDIECTNDEKKMPQPDKNPIITIACIAQEHEKEEPYARYVFTLNTCAPIVGAVVKSFHSESDLLQAWRDFVQEVDPDIITGYNICNFDLPYIIDRAKHLKLKDFASFSRISSSQAKVKSTTFSSKALGTRDSKDISKEAP
jgi:DNA polymerase delta subunit 1